jgi:hypothetical protein
MRDARTQGAQERGAGRDRFLAGRGPLSLLVVVRFATAIVFDALAFVVWDVGTRPPLRLLRDVWAGLGSPAVVLRGIARFVVGAVLLYLAVVVAMPAIPTATAYTIIEAGMLVAALIVEQLVGDDLRGRVRRRPA